MAALELSSSSFTSFFTSFFNFSVQGFSHNEHQSLFFLFPPSLCTVLPSQPQDVKAVEITNSSVRLSWSPGFAGIYAINFCTVQVWTLVMKKMSFLLRKKNNYAFFIHMHMIWLYRRTTWYSFLAKMEKQNRLTHARSHTHIQNIHIKIYIVPSCFVGSGFTLHEAPLGPGGTLSLYVWMSICGSTILCSPAPPQNIWFS